MYSWYLGKKAIFSARQLKELKMRKWIKQVVTPPNEKHVGSKC